MVLVMEEHVANESSKVDRDLRVWVMTSDPQTAVQIQQVLDDAQGPMVNGVCGSLVQLTTALERDPTPVVIVDLDPQPSLMLQRLEPVIARFGHTRFVALSDQFSNALMLEAMQVGVRHFMQKDAIASDLLMALGRLMGGGGAAGGAAALGHVVTVLSAGGGCGATLAAVNLAEEFQLLTHAPALVIDLDTSYGAMATYLGMGGKFGIADLLQRRGVLDPQLVRTTALAYSDDLHALISPASVDFSHPAQLQYEQLEDVIDACRRAYPRTVIDAPRVSMDLAARLAHLSSATLLLMQLSVKDIRTARAIHGALVERDVAPHSIHFVAGRYTRRGTLSPKDACRGLGDVKIELISNDFPAASNAMNMGAPLSRCAPRSGLRHDIAKLAETIEQELPVSGGLTHRR